MWLEGLELGRRKDRWRGKVVWSHASGRVSQLRPLNYYIFFLLHILTLTPYLRIGNQTIASREELEEFSNSIKYV